MKYLWMNDIRYIFQKRKKLLLLFATVLMLSLWLESYQDRSFYHFICVSLGVAFNHKSFEWLELLAYLFNVVVFLFLIVDVYMKDMSSQLSHIFVRMTPLQWFVKKTIVFSTCMLFLKLVEYLLVGLGSFLLYRGDIIIGDCLFLFGKDFLYILCLQFLLLASYFTFQVWRWDEVFMIGLFVIFMLVFDKNMVYCPCWKLGIGLMIGWTVCGIWIGREAKKLIEGNGGK